MKQNTVHNVIAREAQAKQSFEKGNMNSGS
ncbi:MAG: hypothetical protein HJHJAOHD_02441 [Flavobacteriales bacterium]|nr:hypothetical protein [Flavobacteriales bacterium]